MLKIQNRNGAIKGAYFAEIVIDGERAYFRKANMGFGIRDEVYVEKPGPTLGELIEMALWLPKVDNNCRGIRLYPEGLGWKKPKVDLNKDKDIAQMGDILPDRSFLVSCLDCVIRNARELADPPPA